MMTRYTSAYRVAKAITGIGDAIRIVGYGVGALVFLLGLIGSSSSLLGGTSIVFGLVTGGLIAGGAFILGTVVAAQGQILKATLDTAVNSCPFLQNEERAEIMSLSV
jgi:hypothetical protein